MDVNHELLGGVGALKSKTNKYLLAFKKVNLDDSGWHEEVKSLELDTIKD